MSIAGAGLSVASQGDPRAWAPAQVLAVDAADQRLSLVLNGGIVRAPYGADATYAVNDTVAVLMDAAAGPLVLFKLATAPAPGPVGAGPSNTAAALILPTWSGTWRAEVGGWDRWNTTRYGGRSDMYQGDDFGSGPLVGLAVYGDQVAALGATAILSVTARVVLSNGSGAPVLQGSPHGAQPAGAPSSGGDTVTGLGDVALTAGLCEDLRTGAAKGLALVGPSYVAIRGTSLADGMALSITYTKPI